MVSQLTIQVVLFSVLLFSGTCLAGAGKPLMRTSKMESHVASKHEPLPEVPVPSAISMDSHGELAQVTEDASSSTEGMAIGSSGAFVQVAENAPSSMKGHVGEKKLMRREKKPKAEKHAAGNGNGQEEDEEEKSNKAAGLLREIQAPTTTTTAYEDEETHSNEVHGEELLEKDGTHTRKLRKHSLVERAAEQRRELNETLAEIKAVDRRVCTDTDNGATDQDGDGCAMYVDGNGLDRGYCNKYDDSDFTSGTMCCICGGGNAGQDAADVCTRGSVWCHESTSAVNNVAGESGYCCSQGDCPLETVRGFMTPVASTDWDSMPVCWYHGGSQSGTVDWSQAEETTGRYVPLCSVVDGSAASSAYPCYCGTAECQAGTWCTSSTNTCGASQCLDVAPAGGYYYDWWAAKTMDCDEYLATTVHLPVWAGYDHRRRIMTTYCGIGKIESVRRRGWAGQAEDHCEKTCGYCT